MSIHVNVHMSQIICMPIKVGVHMQLHDMCQLLNTDLQFVHNISNMTIYFYVYNFSMNINSVFFHSFIESTHLLTFVPTEKGTINIYLVKRWKRSKLKLINKLNMIFICWSMSLDYVFLIKYFDSFFPFRNFRFMAYNKYSAWVHHNEILDH